MVDNDTFDYEPQGVSGGMGLPKTKPVQREWKEQKTDNAFLSKALPPEAYYTAIDHARKMSLSHGKMRKDRGIKSGIADWLIVWNGITLWIERKAGSVLSDNQTLFKAAVERNGHQWRLARSLEEVEAACRSVGIPLRASLGEIRTRIEDQNARIKPRAKAKSGKPPRQRLTARGRRFSATYSDLLT